VRGGTKRLVHRCGRGLGLFLGIVYTCLRVVRGENCGVHTWGRLLLFLVAVGFRSLGIELGG
jgi:hypothetical protein